MRLISIALGLLAVSQLAMAVTSPTDGIPMDSVSRPKTAMTRKPSVDGAPSGVSAGSAPDISTGASTGVDTSTGGGTSGLVRRPGRGPTSVASPQTGEMSEADMKAQLRQHGVNSKISEIYLEFSRKAKKWTQQPGAVDLAGTCVAGGVFLNWLNSVIQAGGTAANGECPSRNEIMAVLGNSVTLFGVGLQKFSSFSPETQMKILGGAESFMGTLSKGAKTVGTGASTAAKTVGTGVLNTLCKVGEACSGAVVGAVNAYRAKGTQPTVAPSGPSSRRRRSIEGTKLE